jgi:predicted nucleic acid-binding protein
MNIVIDTNIFISALIKEGIVRKIIAEAGHNLLFPEFEFEEIKRHKQEIIKKSGLSEKEFDILLLRLLNYVKIIPTNIILNYKKRAFEIIGKIDSDDTMFIATALAFNCPIWSEDKHFKKQNKIKIITTKDMVDYLK